MVKTTSQQVLDDFMATLATNPNADRKQLMQAFPEFGNDEKLLDAAYDYRETRLQNPMADMQTINSKFPEFFEEPVEQQQGVSLQTYQNPAITTNSWEGKDLDDLTAEDYENYLAYAAKQKQQPQQPTGGKIYASPSTLDVMEHFGNAFVKGPLAANKEYMEKMEEKALAEQHSEQRKREKRSSLPLSKQDMALMGGVWSTVGEKPYPSLTQEDLPIVLDQYEKLAELMLQRHKEGNPFTFYHYMIDLKGGPCIYKRISGCGSGTEYMAVTPWGDLYPCHQFVGEEKFKLGDIWNGVTNTEIQNEFAACNVYTRPECEDCWAKLYCSGGCAANAYHATGSVNGVYKYGCELFKKRMECAIMLEIAKTMDGE